MVKDKDSREVKPKKKSLNLTLDDDVREELIKRYAHTRLNSKIISNLSREFLSKMETEPESLSYVLDGKISIIKKDN